ncbi:MAG: portal protein [Alphaproteobacteria bacterium]
MENITQMLLKRYDDLAAEKQILENIYKDIATYIRPQRLDGWHKNPQKGNNLYDSTAVVAADQLAACLWSFLCNGASRWFKLKNADIEGETLQQIEDDIYQNFDQYGFYAATHELFRDLVSFGNGYFVSDSNASGFSFKALHPMECVFACDNKGAVAEVFRLIRQKENGQEKTLIHCVIKNNATLSQITALPWVSVIIDQSNGNIMRQGGYQHLPYNILRFSSSTGSPYGESPAMLALADIKMLNMMVKTNLMAAQKQIDPPLLAADELSAQGIRTHPGAIVYGGLDGISNKRLIEPLNIGGSVGLGLEMEEQRRKAIKEAFYYQITSTLSQPRSATEVVIDTEDRLRLIYPLISRIFAEFIRPLLKHITSRIVADKYPDLQNMHFDFESLSPLALAQKQQSANKLVKSLQALAPLFAVDNRLKGHIDALVILKELASGWGLPHGAITDEPADIAANPSLDIGAIINQLPQLLKGAENAQSPMD